MNTEKTGSLIRRLRSEKNMTQKELAEMINVSSKAVSKWECAQGCPDITIIPTLAKVLGVDIAQLLNGELHANVSGKNMKNVRFHRCPICGNIITAIGTSNITCCGRILEPLHVMKHRETGLIPNCTETDGELYLTFNHKMTKEHYIQFAAFVTYKQMLLTTLFAEQDAAVTIPKMGPGKLFVCCSRNGLSVTEI